MSKHGKKKPQKKSTLYKAGVVALALLLVGGGVAAGYFFMSQQKKAPPVSQQTQDERRAAILGDADQIAQNEGVDKGAAAYDAAIADSTDAREKSELLASKATLYLDEE